MTPLAIALTKQAWSTMVMSANLRGRMSTAVWELCGQLWSAQNSGCQNMQRSRLWLAFCRSDLDAPDPALPSELGDKPSMTGWLVFMVGDKAGDVSTEHLFHGTSELRKWILLQHFKDE
jgi:hypothetical protein